MTRPEASGARSSIAVHVLRFEPRSATRASRRWLTPRELGVLASLQEPRASEWTAARVAAKESIRRFLTHGLAPDTIEIERDRFGVPRALVGPRVLRLSLSHTDMSAMAASSVRVQVGVDVEVVRPIPADLSGYFLGPDEEAALKGWGDRATASLAAWTVKEAVLKARGLGLTLSPRAVTIRSIEPDGHVAVTCGRAEVAAACWREDDTVAAVACAGSSEIPSISLSRSEI